MLSDESTGLLVLILSQQQDATQPQLQAMRQLKSRCICSVLTCSGLLANSASDSDSAAAAAAKEDSGSEV